MVEWRRPFPVVVLDTPPTTQFSDGLAVAAAAHAKQYRKLISGYMIRHKVRPGITGLAQVSGLRGETETLEKMTERVRYDLEYLRNWSPWLDIKILLRTVRTVMTDHRNVY